MKRLLAAAVGLALIVLLVAAAVRGSDSKVYLVPLEAEPELLHSLKAYYQQELELDIEILPSLQFTSATWNERRQQASAEQVIKLIDAAYPHLKSPTPGIVIGITSRDMFIENRPGRFAFSLRQSGRMAIVSYARMDPLLMERYPDPQLLETRLRKMVTRNIGVMKYGLRLTGDPYDLMYQDVLGLDDLDNLIEDLPRAGFPNARPALPTHTTAPRIKV